MIRSSFIFLDRIGPGMEKRIWDQGVRTWDDFLNAEHIEGLSDKAKAYHERKIREASRELYSLNSSYFLKCLPHRENWRLYRFFRDEAIFLDIETSGVESHDDVTVVGLFDGTDTKVMIRGINLDFSVLKKALEPYKVIVTFNGSSFDFPFIKKRYPGVLPEVPHIDIRHVCDRAGLSGGLKEIEKKLGLKRSKIIDRFYGGDPFRLWRMYRVTGDEYYLNLLVEYNEDDVINLKIVADKVLCC